MGIELGEIVRVTQHQHDQHSWRNPFERRRETHFPDDLVPKRPLNPSLLVESDFNAELAGAAARQD